jgi:hypothetical protein
MTPMHSQSAKQSDYLLRKVITVARGDLKKGELGVDLHGQWMCGSLLNREEQMLL